MENNSYKGIRRTILIFNLISTLIHLLAVAWNYYLLINYLKISKKMLKIDSLSSSMKLNLAFEIILNVVMPYPFTMDYTFQEYVYINDIYVSKRYDTILLVLMYFFRFYHIVTLNLIVTRFMDNRAQRVCGLYGALCGFMFAFKCWFKQNSLVLSFVIYLFVSIVFGALFRFNGEQAHMENSGLQEFSWSNSMW
mmetsp:Transcript_13191/g.15275  ORF Transcript_13191/g.15275 Transcript_13191/m.15275 type:complete len:194 (-) Transcript_13191:508-1089(-)